MSDGRRSGSRYLFDGFSEDWNVRRPPQMWQEERGKGVQTERNDVVSVREVTQTGF
jgi:hypothetical protein